MSGGLGVLSMAWVSAEASLPLGWRVSSLWRFDDLWIALSEGPAFDDYLSGSGQHADQALRRLAERLSERRGGEPRYMAKPTAQTAMFQPHRIRRPSVPVRRPLIEEGELSSFVTGGIAVKVTDDAALERTAAGGITDTDGRMEHAVVLTTCTRLIESRERGGWQCQTGDERHGDYEFPHPDSPSHAGVVPRTTVAARRV